MTTVNSLTTSNILGGHEYCFRAYATNRAGSGPYSELIDPILIKEQNVQKAPVISSFLGDLKGKLGEEASLVVEYSSATRADVKWLVSHFLKRMLLA